MSTINQLAAGIETRLQTISGLNTAAYLSDQVNPPVAIVGTGIVKPHRAFGGPFTAHFTVFLILNRVSDESAFSQLNDFMTPNGVNTIAGAIEGDKTLGGVANAAWVTEAGPPTNLTIPSTGVTYLSCPFTVQVESD